MKKLIETVIDCVCEYQDVSKDKVIGNIKTNELVRARNMITYILRIKYSLTYDEISKHLNKSPTTLVKNFKQFSFEADNNKYIKNTVYQIQKHLESLE